MKTLLSVCVLSLSLLQGVAFAADESRNEGRDEGREESSQPSREAPTAERPCKKIVIACKEAGYTRGGHERGSKGLWHDCFKPVLKGQAVPGVNVAREEIEACQARMKACHGAFVDNNQAADEGEDY